MGPSLGLGLAVMMSATTSISKTPPHMCDAQSKLTPASTMAAKFPLSSSLTIIKHPLQQNPSSFFCPLPCTFSSTNTRASHFKLLANLGGGDAEVKKEGKKKFITKEEEPEQYWQTAGEREGENPMKTPLPYIIIFGMSTPFVILAIAFANGWVKVPVR